VQSLSLDAMLRAVDAVYDAVLAEARGRDARPRAVAE
jgi:hypothetical protein